MSENRRAPQAKPAPQAMGGGPRGPRVMGPRQPIKKENVVRLMKYVAPYWPRLVVVLICIILNAVATASATFASSFSPSSIVFRSEAYTDADRCAFITRSSKTRLPKYSGTDSIVASPSFTF